MLSVEILVLWGDGGVLSHRFELFPVWFPLWEFATSCHYRMVHEILDFKYSWRVECGYAPSDILIHVIATCLITR